MAPGRQARIKDKGEILMIIGISGKIGTGKTTLAKCIRQGLYSAELYPVRIGFGDGLKQEAAKEFSFDVAMAYSEEGKGQYIYHHKLPGGCMAVRKILQYWGELRRDSDPDYWVKQLDAKIGKPIDGPQDRIVLIDDVRRPNEAEYTLSNTGYLGRIMPYPGWKPGKYAKHESETALDDWTRWHFVAIPDFGQIPEITPNIIDGWRSWRAGGCRRV